MQKDDADGKWKKWWETSQAQAMGITKNADGEIQGENADYRNIFKNRDKRFYATVTYDATMVQSVVQDNPSEISGGGSGASSTSPVEWKSQ